MLGRSLSQQCSLRFSSKPGSRKAAAAAAVPKAAAQHWRARRLLPPTATAAGGALSLGAAQQLDDIVPYVDNRAPQLRGRQLPQDPVQWVWQEAAKAALRGELLLAAYVDKHKAAPYIMSVLAGALTALGLDGGALLQHGLPLYMPDLLLRAFGTWDTTLWAAALTAVALPVTAWAVRAWWRANMALLANAADSLQQLWQQQQQQQQQHPASSEAVQPQQQQQQSGDSSHWVAAAVTLLRGVCLGAAANSFIGVLYSKGASSTALAVSAGSGAAAVAVAVVSLVLLHRHSNSSGSSQRTQTLAAVFASEAAWLAATVGLGVWASAAAGLVLAGSLYTLHAAAVAPALLQYRAAAGDAVEVHVGLRLAGTRPFFDSTFSQQPISVHVGPVPTEVLEQWEAAASADINTMEQQPEQQQEAGGDADAGIGSSSSSSESDAPIITRSLHEVQGDLQSWMARPMARWEALKPFVAHAAGGLYLGQRMAVPLYNPKIVGYWNPNFTWWQPIAEVQEKFAGNMPGPGDVFWYPVADGAAVLTRVNAVGRDYVELDANYGVTDTQLELEVQLVRLHKRPQE